MDNITIGLWVTSGMLVLVFFGMRVAFAAAMAGFVGLIWIFWARFDYDPDRFSKALTIAVKTAGQVPHSKVSAHALSLIPTFILIGYLAYYARLTTALFDAAKKWIAWVPGAKRLLRNSRLLAFTDVLQLLVEQQVPMHEALRLAGSASGDRGLREDAARLATQMELGRSGGKVSKSSNRYGIPSFLRWELCNNRQLGQLESTLDRARRTYRYRTEDSATWLRTFLPVCFSFCLGGFVALIYVSLFLVPWFGILRLISEPLTFLG